ncbi:helix-turn-helix transcriptional regulator [Gilliamella sp. GillExp13]|uniref:helix-turn-helix transcriptional regulator n=1 Tax=Gilliamella sp. GillExp13 TaxID=3120243 RepID=UPI00159EEA64|nr:AlpA family transcriptional regulator [Gilliamella apicola]
MGGLDQTTLDKWVAKGEFPRPDLYLGRHPRWRLSTINAYLAQKEQEYQSCG